MTITRLRAVCLLALSLAVAPSASADSFVVTLDTSPLSGPQTIIFALSNFDAGANSVSLFDFSFGGGGSVAGSQDCTFGGTLSGAGCSGDLTTAVLLQDLDVLAMFSQQFNPGTVLSFTVSSTNDFVGAVPDQFSMFLCDSGGTCYSDDADTGALLLLDLAGGHLISGLRVFGASAQNLAAPVVSTTAPEPGTVLLLGAGLVAALVRRRGPR